MLSVFIIMSLLCGCNPIVGEYEVKTEDRPFRITLYQNKTFIQEELDGGGDSYYGHWKYTNQDKTEIEITIEGSGLEVYTLTPQNDYRIVDGQLIKVESTVPDTKPNH